MPDSFGLLKQLDEKELLIYNAEIQKLRKSTLVAYLLWFFFGGIGAHKFYLGKSSRGFIYILLSFAWLCGFVAPVLFLFAIPLGLLLFVDIFTIPGQVRAHQDTEGEKLAQRLLATRS